MTNCTAPHQPVPTSPGSPFKLRAPQPAPNNALATTNSADAALAAPEEYDPADYRWVPVRRAPRYDGWTEEKQRRFIEDARRYRARRRSGQGGRHVAGQCL